VRYLTETVRVDILLEDGKGRSPAARALARGHMAVVQYLGFAAAAGPVLAAAQRLALAKSLLPRLAPASALCWLPGRCDSPHFAPLPTPAAATAHATPDTS
jgi:hypothetical protein